MDKIKRLRIPDFEKEKGFVWVAYPVCDYNWQKVIAIAELKIKQEWN